MFSVRGFFTKWIGSHLLKNTKWKTMFLRAAKSANSF